jgi:hypothetical protein
MVPNRYGQHRDKSIEGWPLKFKLEDRIEA